MIEGLKEKLEGVEKVEEVEGTIFVTLASGNKMLKQAEFDFLNWEFGYRLSHASIIGFKVVLLFKKEGRK